MTPRMTMWAGPTHVLCRIAGYPTVDGSWSEAFLLHEHAVELDVGPLCVQYDQMGIGRPLEEGAQVVAVGIGGPAAVPGQKCRRRYSGLVEEGVRDDGGERSWVRIRPRVSPCSIHSSRSCESVRIFSGSTFSPYFPAAISATSCARSFFASRMPTPSSGRWPGCTNVFTTYLPVAALYARNS